MTVPAEITLVNGCHVGLQISTYVYLLIDIWIILSILKRFVHLALHNKYSAIRKFYCLLSFRFRADCRLLLLGLAGAWEALYAYDSIIFSLILYKTWKVRRDYAVTGIEIPLISLILRDGEIQSWISLPPPKFSKLIFFGYGYRHHLFLVRAIPSYPL